ncbi:hydroxyacylglutathione hydrolase [Dokdonella fugitiva]|jgi:hydroxyacylglutathione hydrolase|uniref:Hydroxyacylglutathione hydrolase n=1 Tax=Dokdonella fugitiva TaxID=328517 RepID=A0A4R2HUS4_9GAMM|nr:hydroxyacylglutathione hydrolase [Dokdonella fugitiva]MBA8885319.1 hydroxyacylglutathione hydrolase [Dokdonella fugitiva]TCO34947.1 hydroxyacylglutathione hydrolase [Dokdonella fugitiva]
MILTALPALADNYIWLLEQGGDALVVDPGEAGPVERVLAERGLRLQAILLTHHHNDHIGAARELASRHGSRVHAPHDERIAAADVRVGDGDRVMLERPAFTFDVLGVPGHTRSHIAFHGAGVLFCGDTLFSVGCGRLFEGTPAQMLASLERLAALPDDTRVCCGHEYTLANCAFARTVDPSNAALAARTEQATARRARGEPTVPSTLADERATNPFLRIDAPALRDTLGVDDRVARFAELRRRKDEFRMPAP